MVQLALARFRTLEKGFELTISNSQLDHIPRRHLVVDSIFSGAVDSGKGNSYRPSSNSTPDRHRYNN